jgi:hypothetical protein
MAVKAYRDKGRSMGIKKPEMIASVSAHPAFDKVNQYVLFVCFFILFLSFVLFVFLLYFVVILLKNLK